MAQEIKAKDVIKTDLSGIIGDGQILPNDDITVFATGITKGHTAGQPVTCHKVLAAKMVAAGKATYEATTETKKTQK